MLHARHPYRSHGAAGFSLDLIVAVLVLAHVTRM